MLIHSFLRLLRNDFRSAYHSFLARKRLKRTLEALNPREHSHLPVHITRKTKEQIEAEIYALVNTHKGAWTLERTIQYYFLYGCDAASVNTADYVFQEEFDGYRDRLNPRYATIMNEKEHVSAFLAYRGINATHTLGKTDSSGMFLNLQTGHKSDFIAWFNTYGKPIFAKVTCGNQGKGCFKCERKGNRLMLDDKPVSEDELRKIIPNHLIECYIEQLPAFAAVHPQSVNDIRIVTVRKGDEIQIYGAFARFGVGGIHVDNIHAGGICVGIRPNGCAADNGFIICGEKCGCYTEHPDSGIIFSQYTIPMWEQCCECARAAHREFPFLHSCGWDVGITPDGPIIIEGNAGWNSSLLQVWFGPARGNIKDFFPSPGC